MEVLVLAPDFFPFSSRRVVRENTSKGPIYALVTLESRFLDIVQGQAHPHTTQISLIVIIAVRAVWLRNVETLQS